MSQLPRIPSATPASIPASEAKTFPDWFMLSLVINAAPESETKCAVSLSPFDYDTGELGPSENAVRIEFADLRTTAASRAADGKPALAQALGAVLLAVAEIAAESDTTQPVIEIE